jgi:hypothetical protein
MSSSGKLRAEKFLDDGDGFVLAHDSAAKCDDIRVVVFARPTCRERIVRQRRANPFHFVRRDANSNPRAANEDTQKIDSRGHTLPNRLRIIGIVYRFFRVRAYIFDRISRALQVFLNPFLYAKSGVVRAHNNPRFVGSFRQETVPTDSIGIRWGIPISLERNDGSAVGYFWSQHKVPV